MSKFNKQLLVEGNDDMHVIMALCQKFSVTENFEIIDCKGIDKLFTQIPIRLKQSGFETLGIIIDADTGIKSRWSTLQSIFSKQGISLPDEIPNEGLILKTNSLTIGVWIMPNNDLNGMLEDFISFLIPKEDKLLPVANQTLEAIEKEKLNKYIPAHKSKALIHSWLSWQEYPGTPMGLAITKKFLTTQEEICKKLISWLTVTFQ
jgi:hypothetical protein